MLCEEKFQWILRNWVVTNDSLVLAFSSYRDYESTKQLRFQEKVPTTKFPPLKDLWLFHIV